MASEKKEEIKEAKLKVSHLWQEKLYPKVVDRIFTGTADDIWIEEGILCEDETPRLTHTDGKSNKIAGGLLFISKSIKPFLLALNVCSVPPS